MATENTKVTGWADQDHVPGIKSELLELNMGPQHPATHGVLRRAAGDRRRDRLAGASRPVTSATCTAAPRRSPRASTGKQWVVYTDRFDYLAPMT